MTKNRGFNFCMVGFKDVYPDDQKYLRCSMHPGTVLIQDPHDNTVMICPSCGLPYKPEELTKETGPQSKFKNNKGPMLLQKNTKKHKMVSEQGDIIPEDDTLTINDMQQGLRVLKYNEWKPEKK